MGASLLAWHGGGGEGVAIKFSSQKNVKRKKTRTVKYHNSAAVAILCFCYFLRTTCWLVQLPWPSQG